MKSTSELSNKQQALIMLGSLALVAVLGLASWYIGWQISFAIFYLLPIFICVHNVGKGAGLFLSIVYGVTWFAIEYRANPHYAHPIICYWNGLALTGFFVIFTLLIASVEESLRRQKGVNKTLESLLTLAPSDKQGWDLPFAGTTRAEAKTDAHVHAATAPLQSLEPPPPGSLPFEKMSANESPESPSTGG